VVFLLQSKTESEWRPGQFSQQGGSSLAEVLALTLSVLLCAIFKCVCVCVCCVCVRLV